MSIKKKLEHNFLKGKLNPAKPVKLEIDNTTAIESY